VIQNYKSRLFRSGKWIDDAVFLDKSKAIEYANAAFEPQITAYHDGQSIKNCDVVVWIREK
jgi:hypothetical protein